MSSFLDNGGYIVKKETVYPFGNNIRYMDCSCGTQVRNVGENAKAVKCSKCVSYEHFKLHPESLNVNQGYKPTGRPAGWHFMNEFVDKDGNVFHKGVEQPKLKGTLKPTKVKPPKRKVKRRTKDEILVARHKEKLAAQRKVKRELAKQKAFLNGEVSK
tara:strand:- start:712 stop:1185 length:474 start_codon:yes stop_codon:yes gene_type:complete